MGMAIDAPHAASATAVAQLARRLSRLPRRLDQPRGWASAILTRLRRYAGDHDEKPAPSEKAIGMASDEHGTRPEKTP
jgi:hypothetical protein